MNAYIQKKQADFQNIIDFFHKDLSKMRAGRANPSLLDGITAEAYGMRTPLNGLANISVTDAMSMTVTPWDKGALKDIEKALIEANLGVSVVNEGDKIRVSVPQMTEENRKDIVKKMHERMEESRISIRQIRDKVKEDIERAEEEKEVNEDDKYRFIKELDEEVKKKNEELESIRKKKEEEIMKI